MVARNALNGGLWFATTGRSDAAVALVDPKYSTLLVLNVRPQLRGMRIGEYLVRYLVPNYVRALESAEGFFVRLGYVRVGEPMMGRRLTTVILVRDDLLRLAGRVRRVLGHENTIAPSAAP